MRDNLDDEKKEHLKKRTIKDKKKRTIKDKKKNMIAYMVIKENG